MQIRVFLMAFLFTLATVGGGLVIAQPLVEQTQKQEKVEMAGHDWNKFYRSKKRHRPTTYRKRRHHKRYTRRHQYPRHHPGCFIGTASSSFNNE